MPNWELVRSVRGDRQDTRPLRPTMFVGLGGTGLKVVARLRRRLFDLYGDADYWRIYGFLGIDSDRHELGGRGKEGEKGSSIPQDDCVDITMDAARVKTIVRNRKGKYRHLDAFLPANLPPHVGFEKGAQQRRPIGRMLFLSSLDKVIAKLEHVCERVRNDEALADALAKGATFEGGPGQVPAVDVVLVSSVAGGTGAGSFLDCAYLVRALSDLGRMRVGEVRGMLVLPDVFEAQLPGENQVRVVYANGYAALRELEHFSRKPFPPFPIRAWGTDRFGRMELSGNPPFQVCYLFSRSNGTVLGDPTEVYDVVGDSLAFAMSGSQLAGYLRSGWSNVQGGVYESELLWTETAEDRMDGGPRRTSQAMGGGKYLKFSRGWSSRFSSMGVSSLTLKLPELRRIAATRLLRQVIEYEVGPVPKDDEILDEAQDLADAHVLVRQNLIGSKLEDRENRRSASILAESPDAATASTKAAEQISKLEELAQAVAAPEHAQHTLAERLTAKVDRLIRQDAEKLCGGLTGEKEYQRLRSTLQEVRKIVLRAAPKELTAPKTERETVALRQWENIDQSGVDDFLRKGEKAVAIIRKKFSRWLRGKANALLTYTNDLLLRRYLLGVAAAIEAQVKLIAKGIEDLTPWTNRLRDQQNDLAQSFASDRRNIVLGGELAAPAGSDNEAALDEEIAQALREASALEFERPEEMFDWARERLLVALARQREINQATSSPSILRAQSSLALRHPDLLERLTSIAANDLLAEFPGQKDIYVALAAEERSTDALLQNAIQKAQPYWEINQADDTFEENLDRYRVCGAVEQANSPRADQIRTQLGKRGWQFRSTETGGGGSGLGELVFATDFHGFSLPSLSGLEVMRANYHSVISEGHGDDRHLDPRLRSLLPDLRTPDNEVVTAETNSWDSALLGVILGIFHWEEEASSFTFYEDEDAQAEIVGDDVLSIGRWLRSSAAREKGHDRQVAGMIQEFFEERVQAPFAAETDKETAARREIRILLTLELILDLLEEHAFPVHRDGESVIYPPLNTMIRRVREKYPRQYLEHLYREWKMLRDERGKESRAVSLSLHRVIGFVGPRRPVDALEPDEKKYRLIRAADRLREDGGRGVLEEAHAMGWFPDVLVVQKLKSLFPRREKTKTTRPTVLDVAGETAAPGPSRPAVAPPPVADPEPEPEPEPAAEAQPESETPRRPVIADLGELPPVEDEEPEPGEPGETAVPEG